MTIYNLRISYQCSWDIDLDRSLLADVVLCRNCSSSGSYCADVLVSAEIDSACTIAMLWFCSRFSINNPTRYYRIQSTVSYKNTTHLLYTEMSECEPGTMYAYFQYGWFKCTSNALWFKMVMCIRVILHIQSQWTEKWRSVIYICKHNWTK